MILDIILVTICLVLILVLIKCTMSIKSIRNQIEYISVNETNKMVSKDMSMLHLGELVDEINELVEKHRKLEIESKNAEKALKQTITNISHDIRTPLTSLDGYFQLLSECDSEEKKNEYYTIIDERIGSLKAILEELFSFVRLQNDEYEIELTKTNISKVVCDVILSFYADLQNKHIEPQIDIPKEQYYGMVNEVAMKRVVQNVIKNALDHGIEEIRIKVYTNEKLIFIEIENNFSEDIEIDRSLVFERFYMADKARRGVSTGLGLSIAKLMLLKMNGSIEAYGEDDSFGIRIAVPME